LNAPDKYIINELRKEEAWRMFRIMGEFTEGFDPRRTHPRRHRLRLSPHSARRSSLQDS